MAQAFILWDDAALAEGKKTEADGTHTFSLDGKTWEIDLTKENLAELEKDLARWVKAARRRGGPGGPRAGRKPSAYYEGLQAFAKQQGIEIPTDKDGKNQYPITLRRKYDAYLAEQGRDL